jgi:hypothetical protein
MESRSRARARTESTVVRGSSRRQVTNNYDSNNYLSGVFTTLLVIIFLLFLIFSYFYNQPKNVFSRLSKRFILNKYNEISQVFGSGIDNTKPSKKFILSAKSSDKEVNEYFSNIDLALEVGNVKKLDLVNFRLNYMNQSLVDVTGTYKDGNIGILKNSKDKEYYTSDINKFFSELTGENIDVKSYINKNVSKKEEKKILIDYLNTVFSVIRKNNVSLKSNSTEILDQVGSDFKGKVYTFKPSSKDIEQMLIKLATKLESDKKLVDVLKRSGKDLELMTLFSYLQTSSKSIDDLVKELADNIKSYSTEIGSALEVGGFNCQIGVTKNNIQFIRISYNDSSNGLMVLGYETKEDKSQKESIYFYTEEKNKETVSLTEINEKSKKSSKGKLMFSSSKIKFEINYDLDSSKKFTFLPIGSYDFSIENSKTSANLVISKKEKNLTDYVLTMDNLNLFGNEISRLVVNMEEENDIKLTAPEIEPTNMDNLSSEKYRDILDSIEQYMTKNIDKLFGQE